MDIKNTYKISLIIPYFNPIFNYFKSAIYSILAQSYTNWEVIIIDDGSNTQSRAELKGFIKELSDERFKLLHLAENTGQAAAKNRGLEVSSGEIITFLDTDDLFLPWHFMNMVNQFRIYPACTVLLTDYVYYINFINRKRKLIISDFCKELSDEKINNYIDALFSSKASPMPFIAFRNNLLTNFRFDISFKACEDIDFYYQILDSNLLDKNSIRILPQSTYIYRIHSSINRVTHNLKLLTFYRDKLINKYSREQSLVFHLLKNIIDRNLLLPYDFSYIKEIKRVIRENYPIRLKFHLIYSLFFKYISEKITLPLFGVDERYLHILIEKKDCSNKVKLLFKEYINNNKEEKNTVLAEKVFSELF